MKDVKVMHKKVTSVQLIKINQPLRCKIHLFLRLLVRVLQLYDDRHFSLRLLDDHLTIAVLAEGEYLHCDI